MSKNNSRVKEVEVWVDIKNLEYAKGSLNSFVAYTDERDKSLVKCKLLIPQEERKIELSNAILDKLYDEYLDDGDFLEPFYFYLKQKLFGEVK